LHRGLFTMESTPLPQLESLAAQVEAVGWGTAADMVEGNQLDRVTPQLPAIDERRGGVRDLLALAPSVGELAEHAGVRSVARAVLGPECFVVRALLFDKTPATNWKVAWHQDLTIAVAERIDVPGYGPWSTKGGILHVQPPTAVLEWMLAVRVHLDDCGPENGPLRIVPGSHRQGRLDVAAIRAWIERGTAVDCPIGRGGILAFRPLLLHASSRAAVPRRRRVIHIEFAGSELSGGLRWHTRR
jgi:ectoine hydroxylase-related dioxygenase (phytanoyl-CoA dioxygenase family)